MLCSSIQGHAEGRGPEQAGNLWPLENRKSLKFSMRFFEPRFGGEKNENAGN